MTQFLSTANALKEIGSTTLIICAALWFAFKYLPNQMKRQGQVEEILRNNTAVIENCTEVLRMVSAKDDKIQAALHRCETSIAEARKTQSDIALDIHDIKNKVKN